MAPPRTVHQGTTFLLSAILVVLGVAMIVSTLARGGGVLSYGLLVGLCFIVAGGARLWLTQHLARRGQAR